MVEVHGSNGGGGGFYTFAMVEERLVETMHLWARSPGEGHWPFAADAPWHLMTRATRAAAGGVKGMDLWRMLQADDDEETRRWQGRDRPMPLTRDDVARRDEASAWIMLVAERDRRLVVLVLSQLVAGVKRINWSWIRQRLGAGIENKGLYRRYTRAIAGVTKRLNGEAA